MSFFNATLLTWDRHLYNLYIIETARREVQVRQAIVIRSPVFLGTVRLIPGQVRLLNRPYSGGSITIISHNVYYIIH